MDTASYIAILGDSAVLAKGTPEEVRASEFLTEEILGKDIKSDSTKKGEQNLLNQVTEGCHFQQHQWQQKQRKQ